MLSALFSNLNFHYLLNTITTRSFLAFFFSLAIAIIFGGKVINFLRTHQGKGQPIREDGPQSHLLTKKGTPTMGGLIILGSATISTLLFCQLNNPFVWISLLILAVYGFVGFVDDYVKVKKQTANAMSAKMKLLLQFSSALVAVLVISHYTPEAIQFKLSIPYFKSIAINLWWFYVPFAMIVITGSSNAVNLSDGLDGLATGLMFFAFLFFMAIAYVCGTSWSEYFNFHYIPAASEITVLCAAVLGGLMGFLWFNAPPAKVFMGDTGSLSLGALLGVISVMLKSEILLAIVGFVFVAEALSVMIQVFWFKRTGKRVFKMAPIHHHFEQLGWPETTVVIRFWIVSFICTLLGLAVFIF